MTTKVNQKRAALLLDVTTHTLRRWEKAGKIRCTRVGQQKVFFEISDLERMRRIVNPTTPDGGGNSNG